MTYARSHCEDEAISQKISGEMPSQQQMVNTALKLVKLLQK